MYSFYARGAQKRKKDSQVISLFMLLGSKSVKAEPKYVGEIEPVYFIVMGAFFLVKLLSSIFKDDEIG